MDSLKGAWLLALAVAAAASCGEASSGWPVGDGAGIEDVEAADRFDADFERDPPVDMDSAELDVAVDPPVESPFDAARDPIDSIDPIDDAADGDLDAPDTFDEPLICTVDGVRGECLPTAECTGDRVSTPGYCPGPADIQCCIAISAAACDPLAVPQPNAGLVEEPGLGGCPAGMVRVDDFCIDRFEAALEEVLSDDRRIPWSPYFNPGERRVRAVSLRGAVPQGYISGRQAEAACLEAGKRLCSDPEWLRACQGEDSNDYPYGADEIVGACNENRPVHPAIEYFGTSADWIWSQLGHPCINQLDESLAPAGDYAQCVSAEGVYDLVGNLHEWTADPTGVFRGGFYVDTWRNGIACHYATTAHNREHWDYSTGFRCCADAE